MLSDNRLYTLRAAEKLLKSKVTTVGSLARIVLPKEVFSQRRVEKGDTGCFIETPNGVEITPYNRQFEDEMGAARPGMRKYRNALHELALGI